MKAFGAGLTTTLSVIAMLVSLPLHMLRASAPQKTINGLIKLPVLEKNDIRFTQLSVNGESLQSRITNIVQDDYGFLWFGTSDGLYNYDGYNLKSYRHEPGNPNSLSDDLIMFLYKDRDGSIWIGTRHGGLDRLDSSRDVFTHYRHESGNPGSLADDCVNYVHRDRSGRLWIGTGDGLDLLEPASKTFTHYRHNPQDSSSLSGNGVMCIYEDRQAGLWVGTTSGLDKLDRTSGRFSHFLHDASDPHSIGNDYVSSILQDHSGILWVASPMGSGLSALNAQTGEFTRYGFHTEEPSSQSVAGVQGLFEDRDGALWLSTIDSGLLKLDRQRQTFARYSNNPGTAASLLSDTDYTVIEDAEGEMWVGTQNGVSRFRPAPPPFVSYRHEAASLNSLHNDMIWSVQADSRGFLWIGGEDGLNQLDPRSPQFAFYQHRTNNNHSLSYNKVAATREDRSGTLWFGTYGGGLDRFDPATKQFFAYRHNPKDPASLSSDAILSLLIDRRGSLWVGTQGGGLDRFDSATGRFTSFLNDAPDLDLSIPVLLEDRAGILWLGTPDRGLIRFDPKTKRTTAYRHNSQDPHTLSSDKVSAIREDRQGRLWIGTKTGLNLLDRTSGTVVIFTKRDGLSDNAVESILEDRHGYLWLGTHNGISRFDPHSRTFRNYFVSDGLAGNLENPYGPEGSCQTPDGKMVFGSSNGVTVFDPDRISNNPYVPPVELTNFLLFNKPVREMKNSPLTKSIWATNSLTLTHTQSIFALEFAALSYMAPQMNHYRYRLEGFETQWNEVDSTRRSATYTNLPAGSYTFRVQGSNNDGVWNNKGVNLAITVLPPWWATWWFRSVLALIIAATIWAIYRLRVTRLKRETTRLEAQVAERTTELQLAKDAAEEANRAKTNFLANMSHELRTPLNAILGFSNLLRDGRVSEKQRKDLDIINRSGEHLLSLINDVLDMAKIDAGRIVIQNAPLDLRDMLSSALDLMRLRAEEKGLELSMVVAPELCRFVETDGEKLRQVLINLIANALKFTDRGSVILRAHSHPAEDAQHCRLVLEVQDTGVGIAVEDQTRIFEPFVQAGKPARYKGTGLGLAISRKYVELMGGTIEMESSRARGSTFRIEIPVLKLEPWEMPAADRMLRNPVVGLEPEQAEFRVLIVEDQEENWRLLQRILENAGFQVSVTTDGASGIEKFQTWHPHFIWMDWRLPDMDGLETTRRIRGLENGHDVKIVILSAFAFTEYRDEALRAGVDDFVSKPFRTEDVFTCLGRQLGVRYRYKADLAEKSANTLEPEAIAALPADLRKELVSAVTSLHMERIAGVISRISEQNPLLGRTLAEHAERFAYSAILHALQSSDVVTATAK